MARTPLLMGNWKMYKTVAEARVFAEALGQQSQKLDSRIEYAICAPYTSLHVLRVMLPAQVRLGAQNVFPERKVHIQAKLRRVCLPSSGRNTSWLDIQSAACCLASRISSSIKR